MDADIAAGEVASAIDVVVQVVRRQSRRYISEISVVDNSNLDGKTIKLCQIFTGELARGEDGTTRTVFRRVGSVGGDTDLAMKMLDCGVADGWLEETE